MCAAGCFQWDDVKLLTSNVFQCCNHTVEISIVALLCSTLYHIMFTFYLTTQKQIDSLTTITASGAAKIDLICISAKVPLQHLFTFSEAMHLYLSEMILITSTCATVNMFLIHIKSDS